MSNEQCMRCWKSPAELSFPLVPDYVTCPYEPAIFYVRQASDFGISNAESRFEKVGFRFGHRNQGRVDQGVREENATQILDQFGNVRWVIGISLN